MAPWADVGIDEVGSPAVAPIAVIGSATDAGWGDPRDVVYSAASWDCAASDLTKTLPSSMMTLVRVPHFRPW